ncbi:MULTISPECIES: tyrosinase family oxidase copper chaperone [Streptomyces]|uniref:Tyrosinase co-factor MelC1 n=1 Tax=Streptomyces chartreusis NRRL 3882 TaxID=1079985 RepID=A0A2N9BEF6_STRCX|nr:MULTISPECIES: tyrosinase family oxidase copper chaperone [Streptomyces]MYS92567.1 tyrosinase [Streptomyces sp. SID5464]SOR81743.1 Tyrosinase co-factor MelC1 [Streptomyces chartreusis NRRL 3882]
MVVSIGGGPAGGGAPTPARPERAGRTRREVTRGLRACALAATLAAPVAAAFRLRRPGTENVLGEAAFDQTYRSRRIRGTWTPSAGSGGRGRWHVTVDGRPLHLMRRADGTWLSMVDHYCSYRSPLEAARAAVDELGPGRRLRDLAPEPADAGHVHTGDRHGVRA